MVHVINWGIDLWNVSPVLANSASAGIQIALGLLLLLPVPPRVLRWALWGAVAWSAAVWVARDWARS
jgi:hypothetical protein